MLLLLLLADKQKENFDFSPRLGVTALMKKKFSEVINRFWGVAGVWGGAFIIRNEQKK